MKKSVFLLLFSCVFYLGKAQISVLNGSFEQHEIDSCLDGVNLNTSDFNQKILFASAINPLVGGWYSWNQEFDMFADSCVYSHPMYSSISTITPPDGNWYIGVVSADSNVFSGKWDVFTLELSDSLIVNQWYNLSYYHHKGDTTHTTSWVSHRSSRTEIGVSLFSGEFGDSLFTSSNTENAWVFESFYFQAPTKAKHISIKPLKEPGRRYQLVDNFEIREVEAPPPSSIMENNSEPKLLRVVDMLGRESKPKSNTPLFYIYNDGTVEKRITIE